MSDGAREGKGERICLCEGEACQRRLRRGEQGGSKPSKKQRGPGEGKSDSGSGHSVRILRNWKAWGNGDKGGWRRHQEIDKGTRNVYQKGQRSITKGVICPALGTAKQR